MDFEIILSRRALEDLESVITYIAQDNPEAARSFGKKLVEAVSVLKVAPRSGVVVPEFDNDNIRQLIKRPYRIIYKIEEDKQKISISRFWHAGRDNLEM